MGELVDVLTTHPYPAFTPNCGRSALNTIPAIYHAIAETIYYQASGKPAFIEEISAFGPEYLSDERIEAYLRIILYSAYAHDLGGMLWWCGFAFDKCANQLPYRWCGMERNLGALDANRKPTGAARAIQSFQQETQSLPYDKLPPRRVDCTIIATQKPNIWDTVYGSFILSTQAGFEVNFCNIASCDVLPKSKFYLMPSISGFRVITLEKYRQLLKAASEGATLCITAGSGILQPFGAEFGCHVEYFSQEPEEIHFTIDGCDEKFSVMSPIGRRIKVDDCEVLGRDSYGYPVLIKKHYGKGQLIYLNVPLEDSAITSDCKLYHVYRKIAELAGVQCPEKVPEIGITHHPLPEGGEIRIAINYADYEAGGMKPNEVKIETVQEYQK